MSVIREIASNMIFGGKTRVSSNNSRNQYVDTQQDCAYRKYTKKFICHKLV
jgi:hypothetical protein